MISPLEMPRLSDSMTEGTILRWVKQPGDNIEPGEHIADIETSKVNMELLAPRAGTLVEITVPEGEKAQTGQTIATIEPTTPRPYSSSPVPEKGKGSLKMSPLAKKLAVQLNIDTSTVKGTGPRGKIMSGDLAPAKGKAPKAKTSNDAALPIGRKASQEQRILTPSTHVDGYYIYTFEANMSQLADISTPIAVQCEKFLGGRYCLFDYVARGAVKAFSSTDEALNPEKDIDLLMVVNKGTKDIPLPQAVRKTIYNIAQSRNIGEPEDTVIPISDGYTPNLLVCDAGARIKELSDRIKTRPMGMVILGGTSPKTGIEAGRPVQKLMLPLTVYIDSSILREDLSSQVAAEFKTLMENPVLLLF